MAVFDEWGVTTVRVGGALLDGVPQLAHKRRRLSFSRFPPEWLWPETGNTLVDGLRMFCCRVIEVGRHGKVVGLPWACPSVLIDRIFCTGAVVNDTVEVMVPCN